MATFKDGTGKKWEIKLDVYLVEQIQERVGVAIETLLDDNMKGLFALYKAPVQLVRVLWVCVEEQAGRAGVEPEDFGRAIYGDALGDAADAFHEALADFFPKRQRQILKALAAKSNEIATENHAEAMRQIEALSASATNSPGPSASTPVVVG